MELTQKGGLATLEAGSHVDEPDVWQTHPEYYESIYDANSGTKLDAGLVSKGCEGEMDFLQRDLGAWSYDKIENCVQETGKQPIPMTWVDINKGDDMRPKCAVPLVRAGDEALESNGHCGHVLGDAPV